MAKEPLPQPDEAIVRRSFLKFAGGGALAGALAGNASAPTRDAAAQEPEHLCQLRPGEVFFWGPGFLRGPGFQVFKPDPTSQGIQFSRKGDGTLEETAPVPIEWSAGMLRGPGFQVFKADPTQPGEIQRQGPAPMLCWDPGFLRGPEFQVFKPDPTKPALLVNAGGRRKVHGFHWGMEATGQGFLRGPDFQVFKPSADTAGLLVRSIGGKVPPRGDLK